MVITFLIRTEQTWAGGPGLICWYLDILAQGANLQNSKPRFAPARTFGFVFMLLAKFSMHGSWKRVCVLSDTPSCDRAVFSSFRKIMHSASGRG